MSGNNIGLECYEGMIKTRDDIDNDHNNGDVDSGVKLMIFKVVNKWEFEQCFLQI